MFHVWFAKEENRQCKGDLGPAVYAIAMDYEALP